jgi:hypothetical protein
MSFFIISWQALFCDFISLLYQFIQAIPTTFLTKQPYTSNVMLYIGTLDTIGYNGSLFFMFVLTISRLTIFFFENLDEKFFTPPGIFM